MKKQLCPTGEHILIVDHAHIKGVKVHVFINSLSIESEPVQRTFKQGSKALVNFSDNLLKERKLVLNASDCNQLEGKIFKGMIKSSAKPDVMDLAWVIEVYSEMPSIPKFRYIAPPVLNTASSVNDSKTGGHTKKLFKVIIREKTAPKEEEKGGQNAGQIDSDLP